MDTSLFSMKDICADNARDPSQLNDARNREVNGKSSTSDVYGDIGKLRDNEAILNVRPCYQNAGCFRGTNLNFNFRKSKKTPQTRAQVPLATQSLNDYFTSDKAS